MCQIRVGSHFTTIQSCKRHTVPIQREFDIGQIKGFYRYRLRASGTIASGIRHCPGALNQQDRITTVTIFFHHIRVRNVSATQRTRQ